MDAPFGLKKNRFILWSPSWLYRTASWLEVKLKLTCNLFIFAPLFMGVASTFILIFPGVSDDQVEEGVNGLPRVKVLDDALLPNKAKVFW